MEGPCFGAKHCSLQIPLDKEGGILTPWPNSVCFLGGHPFTCCPITEGLGVHEMRKVGVMINASQAKELQAGDACLLTDMPLFLRETGSLPRTP